MGFSPWDMSFIPPYPNTVISTGGALLRRSGETRSLPASATMRAQENYRSLYFA